MRRSRWLVIIAVVASSACALVASGGRPRPTRAPIATTRAGTPPLPPAAPSVPMAADDQPAGFVGVVASDGVRPAAVRFAVPERERDTIAIGRAVAVRAPKGVLTLRVERIALEVEPASRTFVAEARFVDAQAARTQLADGAMVRVVPAVAP